MHEFLFSFHFPSLADHERDWLLKSSFYRLDNLNAKWEKQQENICCYVYTCIAMRINICTAMTYNTDLNIYHVDFRDCTQFRVSKSNLNASRPSEHSPVRGKKVKTFRCDHRSADVENFMVPPWTKHHNRRPKDHKPHGFFMA